MTCKDSSELEAYLSSLAVGHIILVGAADEASSSLSPEALDGTAGRNCLWLIWLKGEGAVGSVRKSTSC